MESEIITKEVVSSAVLQLGQLNSVGLQNESACLRLRSRALMYVYRHISQKTCPNLTLTSEAASVSAPKQITQVPSASFVFGSADGLLRLCT
ncbi:hypothetical protein BpHYR1_052632, partial [Brachionus plicatilis]